MIGASEREIAAVATGSGADRISRAAVVDSLREATRMLDQAMQASVQSAALSQLQAADAQGNVSRDEVARVWLTNVLPAIERAPVRNANGELGAKKLIERLHRMAHGRLSQVMLDELPAAQDAMGLPIDATGGGELPSNLVQPLVATLVSAALRATVHELGDALLALPGLEAMQAGGGGGGPGNPSKPSAYNDDDTETVYSPNSRYTASQPGSPLASELKNGGPISQADALGAAEGLVRRMLDGALHGHHFALALAEDDGMRASGTFEQAEQAGWGVSSPSTGKTRLKLREAEATVERMREEAGQLHSEHQSLLDEHREVSTERNALLNANRQLDAECDAARSLAEKANERSKELTEELRKAFEAREAVEAELAEVRSNLKTQVTSAVDAAQEAARRAFDVEGVQDKMAQERELSALRAARDAEAAASEEARKRADRLEAEKHALERERAALLAERTASVTRSNAFAASGSSSRSPREVVEGGGE